MSRAAPTETVRPTKQRENGAPEPPQSQKAARPLWERALELSRSVPAEERALWPEDGADQTDHYVYGVAKRDE